MKVIRMIEDGRVGGPQVDIVRTAVGLSSKFVAVTVVLPKKNSKRFQSDLNNAGIEFVPVSLTTPHRGLSGVLRYLGAFLPELISVVGVFRSINPDLIHVNGGVWQVKGVMAAYIVRRPLVWHINDTDRPQFVRILFKIFRPLASAFICAGERARAYYLGANERRPVAVIQAPVDCRKFDLEGVRQKREGAVPVIVTVANISPVKSIEVFLQAARLVQESKEAIFRVIGKELETQKEYTKSLRSLIQSLNLINVEFVGESQEVWNDLSKADIFVCSSKSEASPTAVWEAMIMAMPVVSTDVGDVAKFIENGISGYVVPIGDARELAKRILYFIQNPEQADEMGLNARSVALSNFSENKISHEYAEFYSRVIDR